MTTAIERAIKIAGGVMKLADRAEISHPLISYYRRVGYVPTHNAAVVALAVDNKVKAHEFIADYLKAKGKPARRNV